MYAQTAAEMHAALWVFLHSQTASRMRPFAWIPTFWVLLCCGQKKWALTFPTHCIARLAAADGGPDARASGQGPPHQHTIIPPLGVLMVEVLAADLEPRCPLVLVPWYC